MSRIAKSMSRLDGLRPSGQVHMPSLAGATAWINSEPLSPDELRGHVVLVNFWTLTCINWLRTEPYVRAWAERYEDDGLIVLGVHTPEFSFEHDANVVRQAIQDRGIEYPVLLDNDYAVWRAFANHYWPALYFVDTDATIRDQHFGEGRYEQSERLIQRLLGIDRDLVSVEGVGVEAEADWRHLHTPETYLGYSRAEHFVAPAGFVVEERLRFSLPARLPVGHWGLDGAWTIASERVEANEPGASIAFRFHARDAHVVLAPGPGGPIPFRVIVDGEAPALSHGVDVDDAGNGILANARMYQIVRQHGEVRERTVEITFLEAGAQVFVFTFG